MQVGKRKFLYDIILVLVFILVGISAFFVLKLSRAEGEAVRVQVDGETVAEYPLDKDGEYPINGGSNVLVVKDGEAYMKSADCPDRLCVKSGRISRAGEQIICLPNRVSVEVLGDAGGFIVR